MLFFLFLFLYIFIMKQKSKEMWKENTQVKKENYWQIWQGLLRMNTAKKINYHVSTDAELFLFFIHL